MVEFNNWVSTKEHDLIFCLLQFSQLQIFSLSFCLHQKIVMCFFFAICTHMPKNYKKKQPKKFRLITASLVCFKSVHFSNSLFLMLFFGTFQRHFCESYSGKLSATVGGLYGVRRRRKGTTVLLVSFFVLTYDLFHKRLQYRHFVL